MGLSTAVEIQTNPDRFSDIKENETLDAVWREDDPNALSRSSLGSGAVNE